MRRFVPVVAALAADTGAEVRRDTFGEIGGLRLERGRERSGGKEGYA